jgi:hypothetical protein
MRKARSALLGLSSGWTPLRDKMEAYGFVIEQITAGRVSLAHEVQPLDEISQAWIRQGQSPHTKLVISLS